MRLPAESGWSVAQPHPHLGPLPGGEKAPAWDEKIGLLVRETKGEVVLVPRLCAALVLLNPTLPPEAIAPAELNWTPILDPYWTHAGLMIDPSADHSA